MTDDSSRERSIVEWGWAGRGLEVPSGDLHVVVPFTGGVLVALLDGLGHGAEAARACVAAVPILQDYASEPVMSLVRRCHDGLRKTRGAVMSVASIRSADSSVTWTGVGNVDCVLLRAQPTPLRTDQAIAVRAGVVGGQLPPLRADRFVLDRDDTLIMATDGVRSAFTVGLTRSQSPQELAESILARFAKGTDDAHVVVARYSGGAS